MTIFRKVLIGVVGASFIAALALLLSGRPLLFKFTEPGAIVRPTVSIFNPLRDRSPEHVADEVFDELRRGEVRAEIGQMPGTVGNDIVEKERHHRIRRWKLVDRVDDRGTVTLFYRTDRGVSGRLDSEVTMCLRRRAAEWELTDYRPVY